MTELKTLNEIIFLVGGPEGARRAIKAEAIKWVKESDNNNLPQTFREIFYEFFNITEEDLNDK